MAAVGVTLAPVALVAPACSGSPLPHDEIDYKSKSQEHSTDP